MGVAEPEDRSFETDHVIATQSVKIMQWLTLQTALSPNVGAILVLASENGDVLAVAGA